MTDFLGGGEIGYWQAPGVRNRPIPWSPVRIRQSQMQPKDGRYEIRVTNELEEAVFVNRLRLFAITHRRDVEVFPNEGMTNPPKPFRLFQARMAQPPQQVLDDHAHDVTARIAELDGWSPDDFRVSAIRGYAAPHTLTIPLGRARPELLLLTGWTDYAFSSDNVAAHQAGSTLQPPIVEARAAGGQWRTIAGDVGIPVGRPQTLIVDLAAVLPPAATAIRVVTSMRIYWDQILLAGRVQRPAAFRVPQSVGRRASRTGLFRRDLRRAHTTDHVRLQRVTRTSPWKTMPGDYTREGDV